MVSVEADSSLPPPMRRTLREGDEDMVAGSGSERFAEEPLLLCGHGGKENDNQMTD